MTKQRQAFEKGQRVMVHRWGDHWREATVVEPIGCHVGYAYSSRYEARPPYKGSPAYVGVRFGEQDENSPPYWVINRRNKIVSHE